LFIGQTAGEGQRAAHVGEFGGNQRLAFFAVFFPEVFFEGGAFF
jgi:hypothetical protein